MKGQRVRREPQRARDFTGRHSCGSGLDQQAEDVEAAVLDVQGEVGIREALKLDAKVLAHDAARALGADQIAGFDRLGSAFGVLDLDRDRIGVLFE